MGEASAVETANRLIAYNNLARLYILHKKDYKSALGRLESAPIVDARVVIRDGLIAAVGPRTSTPAPERARVIDVSGVVVTRWCLVAEILDEDGDVALATRTSHCLPEWDQVGLFSFALQRSEARVSAMAAQDDDED